MKPCPVPCLMALSAIVGALSAAPALAEGDAAAPLDGFDLAQSQPTSSGDGAGVAAADGELRQPQTIFDGNWVLIGVGLTMLPTYSGSDDYFVFPVPMALGRVRGVGIRPAAGGLTLDFLSPQPAVGSQSSEPSFSLGPTIRFRNNRAINSKDEVVEAAGRLDSALEVGLNAGVTFPKVLHDFDSLILAANIRWDVLGAHKGRLIEPSIAYTTPLSRGVLVQVSASMEFVDDNFSEYYFSVTPQQSAASGLAQYRADGGLNRIGVQTIGAVDFDGNLLNGGWSAIGLAGYSRMQGDGARTPFTLDRGNPNQFLIGVGLAYAF